MRVEIGGEAFCDCSMLVVQFCAHPAARSPPNSRNYCTSQLRPLTVITGITMIYIYIYNLSCRSYNPMYKCKGPELYVMDSIDKLHLREFSSLIFPFLGLRLLFRQYYQSLGLLSNPQSQLVLIHPFVLGQLKSFILSNTCRYTSFISQQKKYVVDSV